MITKEQIEQQINILFSGNKPEANSGSAIGACLLNILQHGVDYANQGISATKMTIQATTNTTITLAGGEMRSVPALTDEQITKAYNQIVSGGSCTITDATGNYHLVVNQADSLSGHPSIGILYYNELALSYVIEDSGVEIYVKEL